MSELTITEVLAAPLARVYAAWTEPDRMRRWFGKADMQVPEANVDLRPGGRWRVLLIRADGGRMPVGGEYREIVPQERLRLRALDADCTEQTGRRAAVAEDRPALMRYWQRAQQRPSYAKVMAEFVPLWEQRMAAPKT